jgi:cytoskeleton protein RodZ
LAAPALSSTPSPTSSAPAPTPAAIQPAKPVPPVPSVPEPVRPGSTQAPSPVAKAEPGSAGRQRLLIKAVEPSWIRVQTDDGRVVEETLPAGASREWSTERRFVVSLGNAGGVEVTINGKVLPVLGGKGAVILRMELPPPPATSGS